MTIGVQSETEKYVKSMIATHWMWLRAAGMLPGTRWPAEQGDINSMPGQE